MERKKSGVRNPSSGVKNMGQPKLKGSSGAGKNSHRVVTSDGSSNSGSPNCDKMSNAICLRLSHSDGGGEEVGLGVTGAFVGACVFRPDLLDFDLLSLLG
mmetsp:Transcript_28361/g.59664  ORF Transcript_28361/g.59664 Transcript_28361/m.59664 type:complete len:100 (+) Transcript_28361:583-882(+)